MAVSDIGLLATACHPEALGRELGIPLQSEGTSLVPSVSRSTSPGPQGLGEGGGGPLRDEREEREEVIGDGPSCLVTPCIEAEGKTHEVWRGEGC